MNLQDAIQSGSSTDLTNALIAALDIGGFDQLVNKATAEGASIERVNALLQIENSAPGTLQALANALKEVPAA